MDFSRLLDSARDPFARRQAPSMALSTNLSSGQPYYTLESLEGASALPLLKSGFIPPSEREALLLDAAKKRNLLAAEGMREALLRRDVSDQRVYADGLPLVDARTRLDGFLPVQRSYVDGLPPVDGRTRLDGLPRSYVDELPPVDERTRLDGLLPVDARTRFSLDELQFLDSRTTTHGLGIRPHDALWSGFDDRARGGLALGAQEERSRSESIRTRELDFGARSGAAPFLPSENYLHGRREIASVRAPAMALDSSPTRRDFVSGRRVSDYKPQSEQQSDRRFSIGQRVPRAPVEAARKQNTSVASAKVTPVKPKPKALPEKSVMKEKIPVKLKMNRPPEKKVTKEKTPPMKPKMKPPPEKSVVKEKTPPITKPASEQSEGWCALCKIDCCNIVTLNIHLNGKKHKAKLAGKPAKVSEPSAEAKATPAATIQANKKRASETKTEASQSTKRLKTLVVAEGNGALLADTPNAGEAKANESKKEKAKMLNNGQGGFLYCEVCSISTTGEKNLEFHLKGKRHAARLKELANS
ncbi:hypothetical protein L7F22_038646 [Adiantum nelumboides]|nr:hypothetical protein [Adiantum nelumboides]